MSGEPPFVGKQRTRAHVLADLSVNHVERLILEAGYSVQRWQSDYGYDLGMKTHDEHGYAEPGIVYWQLKATESLSVSAESFPFDLDVRDYNLWIRETSPVLLSLYDASRKRAYWIHVQRYFLDRPTARPSLGAKTIRVSVPSTQPVNRRALRQLRQVMREVTAPHEWRVIR